MIDEEELTPILEAYKIEITYGFDADGEEHVFVEPSDPMSTLLLVGILEKVKHWALTLEEDEEDD